MTDQSIIAPAARAGRGWFRQARDYELSPATVYTISTVCAGLLGTRLALTEGALPTVLFAGSVCCTTAAIVVLVTRRLLVAVSITMAQAALISIGAWVKLKYMNMVLHAYDLTFHLTSATTLSFLWESYRLQMLGVIAALLASAAMCALAYRADPVRIRRDRAARAVMLGATCIWITAAMTGERRHSQFEYTAMHLSSFYRSWSETLETTWRGQLLEAAPQTQRPPLHVSTSCTPPQKPPHIILIHHESVVQPSLFPQLGHDRRLDRFFQSDSGETHKLRVETYGGASVLTEFSVLTGLSTYSFGGMRQFVQSLMAEKIKETLPQVLATCGYRSALFYPMLKSFTAAEKFFKSVGIQEIYDLKDQKAARYDERDRFYYDNALDDLARHLAGSPRPQFTFIETMATHWPYDQPYEPQLSVPGGRAGTHPELHEYLRRVWLAHVDYEYLRAELARRFPSERFLVVRYGDHHPMATRMLLGYNDGTEAEDVLLDRNSIGFITFFAVNGVNYTPAAFQSPPVLDVPYVGTVLMEAAGLPMPEAYRERQRLMNICDGRWDDCVKREQVLSFHRRLLDAGIVSAR